MATVELLGLCRTLYSALEEADKNLLSNPNAVDVSALEKMLGQMLARQLVSAARVASGET